MTPLAALLVATCLAAGQPATPAIAIVIDDLGYQPGLDRAALAVPGALTYAILPFSPAAHELARRARLDDKEILLHLPMEAEHHNALLGPGALLRSMPRGEFVAAVHKALRAVPYLSGVNNHMGSVLTGDLERMRWLMAELSAAGNLVYLDSRTTANSVAARAALEARVPYAARDVFLDNRQNTAYIEAQFSDLLRHALAHGDAIGIAHPHRVTLEVIRRRLAALGPVELVPLAELVRRRQCRAAVPTPSTLPLAAHAQRSERRDATERTD